MTSRLDEATRLLGGLVAIPSLSGEEDDAAEHVRRWCDRVGLPVVRDDAGIRIEIPGKEPGRSLALASHLDVVPPGDGWTREPFAPVVEDGRLFGRGSGDAKASVTAMLLAARDVADAGGPPRGRLLVLFTRGEESRASTMPEAVARSGPIDAAVVGEPTGLDFAVAQRGLIVAELHARGAQRHAGHAAAAGDRAIETLAGDLLRVGELFAGRSHALLGRAAATPTMLAAGVAKNVVPGEAVATLDVRTTPDWTHEQVVRELGRAMRSEVRVLSDRLVPCETPERSELLAVARRIRPEARPYGSPTCSDWVFLRNLDAVKCGPGDSALSHRANESVRLDEVTLARAFYASLAQEYLA